MSSTQPFVGSRVPHGFRAFVRLETGPVSSKPFDQEVFGAVRLAFVDFGVQCRVVVHFHLTVGAMLFFAIEDVVE